MTHINQIQGIRRTNHTIALYNNNILRPLSPRARDKLPNVSRHCRSRHQTWRELHNDARLLDNPNQPTVDLQIVTKKNRYRSKTLDNRS